MKSKGGTARAGDVVPYIFCLGSGGESSKTGQADRARHPDEVRKADKDCQIGTVLLLMRPSLNLTFSLVQQITTIICPSRYCHPLKDCAKGLRELIVRDWLNVSVSQRFLLTGVVIIYRSYISCIACHTMYWIGLDPSRFRNYSTAEGEELNIMTLDSQIPESERYNAADPLKLRCRHCKTETDFVPIHDRQVRHNAVGAARAWLLTRPGLGRYRNPSYYPRVRHVQPVVRLSGLLVSKCNWRDRSENIYRSTTWGGPYVMILRVGTGRG